MAAGCSSNDSIARRANTCHILKQICGAYIKIRMKLTFYDWRHQPCRQETTVVIKPRLRRALNSPSITVVKCKPKRLPGVEVFIEVRASNGRRTKPKQNKGGDVSINDACPNVMHQFAYTAIKLIYSTASISFSYR